MTVSEGGVVAFRLMPSGLGGKVVIMVGTGNDVQCSSYVSHAATEVADRILRVRNGNNTST